MTKPKSDWKTTAVANVTREALHLELDMEHRDTEHTIRVADLRSALEQAYEAGRKARLRPVPAPRTAEQCACVRCGRTLEAFTPEYIAARLRKLLAEVGNSRPDQPEESEARRNEARAEWYAQAHTVMRVTLAMLADQADGVCAFCSDGGFSRSR